MYLLPVLAQLQLDIDLQPLFDAINQFIPVFLPVIAIGGGIAIALALSTFLVNMIKKSIGGGRG
jgi:hypothetical protein